jgi:benzoate transport
MASSTGQLDRSVSSILADAPMSLIQVLVVFISVLLNALDGFDVLAITFAAPGISEDWAISRSALGVVISASLAGMVAGSVFLAPFADRMGRRPTILVCLVLMAGGMLMTATASSILMLGVYRVITGIGIGAIIPAITAVSAEFSNEKRRNFAVSAMTIGFPVGGLVGGMISAELVDMSGWRAIFVAGGLITAGFIPVVWFLMPESIEFLSARGGSDALRKINTILRRMGHQTISEVDAPPPTPQSADPRELLGPEYRMTTILLIAAYMLHLLTYYFYAGWLPKILTDAGYETSAAIATSSIMHIGGVIGGMVIGWASHYVGLKRVAVISMAGTSVLLAIFAAVTDDLSTLRVVASILGVFMFGGIVGLYAFLARAFPARLRVTGCGMAIACGRGGAVLGPILGGVLLDAGLQAGTALTVVGLTAALGALFLAPIRIQRSDEAEATA